MGYGAVALTLALLAADGDSPKPQAAAPKTDQEPAKVDLGTAIAEVVGRMLATPRFEEHVEVHDRYQEALNAYLRSADVACGPKGPEPSPYDEMNRVAGTAPPPHADLLAGAKWLFHRSKKESAASGRYYVYSVSQKSNPGRIVHVVRDGPVSENSRSLVPGTSWQLVGRFADQGKAGEAITRLQRGESVQRGTESRVLWAASRCLH